MKKIVFITITLISMMIIMQGTVLGYTRTCEFGQCKKTVTGYISGYDDTNHYVDYDCECGNWTDREYYNHSFGSWSNDGYSTGTHSRTCGECGYKQEKSHSFSDVYESSSSGCYYEYCGTCGSRSRTFDHNMTSEVTKSPTCTTSGITKYYCQRSLCSYSYTKDIDPTNHSYPDSWTQTETTHYKNCTVCSTTVSSGNHADNNSDGYCDTCSYQMQKAPVLTLTPSTTLELEYGTTSSFTYDYDGNGTLTALVGSTTIAEAGTPSANQIVITPKKVGETTITLSASETPKYFSASVTATIKVNYGTLSIPTDVSLVYNGQTQYFPNNPGYSITGEDRAINVGTYTVTLELNDNYRWEDESFEEKTVTWQITPKSINSSDITKTATPSSYTYDGNAKVPVVKLVDTSRNTELTDADYEITSYGENKNAGTVIISIKGIGNYNDTTTLTFEIKPKSISASDVSISLSDKVYEYDKTPKIPTITVKDGEEKLTENKDFEIKYDNNTEVGTAQVTITGKGNYDGTIIRTFTIEDTTPPTIPVINARYDSSTGEKYNGGDWTNHNIYVSLNSTDLSGIEKYQYQEGGTSGTWVDMPSGGSKIWSTTIDKTIYFRAKDIWGNYSEASSIVIKIDKISPTVGTVKATLRNETGANYVWGTNTDKSVYIKIDNIGTDAGGSGIKETTYRLERIDPDTNNILETIKQKETLPTTLVKNGTYRIVVTTEDNAGNKVESSGYIIKIEKYFTNTIKLTNLYDLGSGVKEIEITATEEASTQPQYKETITSNEANISKRIKLTDGTFDIVVKIRDKVGNEKTLSQKITNIVY